MRRGGGIDRQEREIMSHRVPVSICVPVSIRVPVGISVPVSIRVPVSNLQVKCVAFQEGKSGVIKYKVIQIQECEVRNADLALIAGPSIE